MKLKTGIKDLEKVLSEYLGIEIEEITHYYNAIEKAYEQKCDKSDSGFIQVDKFKNIKFENQLTKDNWESASLIGLDLPVLFHSEKKDSETVVIIGIDPLRKRKDFPVFRAGKVIVGTPYALHSSFYTERRGRTKAYFEFIKHVFNMGYNIYVTDILKIWMNNCQKTGHNKFAFGREISKSGELLKKELEIIKPKAIIAFGELVTKYCHGNLGTLTCVNQAISLPHPSGSNNNQWRDLIEGRKTCENKIAYLNKEIEKHLGKIVGKNIE